MIELNKRIAVIGAGMAGATCAHTLAQAGCQVTLFDKARGVSGRFSAQVNYWRQRGLVAQWQPRVADPDSQVWFVGTPDMPTIVRDLVNGLSLHLNTRIINIEQNASDWQLSSDKGDLFKGYTDLVIAAPPAQAVPLVQSVAPSMVGVLSSIDMQPCWTVMVTTSDAVTTSLPLDAERVVGHPMLIWWARNDSKPGRVRRNGQADWVIQATAEWTLAHLDTDPIDVTRLLCDAFWRHVGVISLPKVEQSMAHRWLYSRRHLEPQSTQPSLWAANMRLGVCGDGLIHSRIESAYASGLHMAQTVLAGQ